jgi:hypothetical protein
MKRAEVLQEVRIMRFSEIHDRFRRGRLSAVEAAEWLGVSERTFRRMRGRYETEGVAGLLDRRLGKISPHRIAADEVDRIVALYRDRYAGWTAEFRGRTTIPAPHSSRDAATGVALEVCRACIARKYPTI